MPFLPNDIKDLKSAHGGQLDIIIVSGDAYIDHPSFGAAIIARNLEANGFSVGIIDQPDWKKEGDFLKLGKPRLFFGVTAGNLDSMVANYTADKKVRRNDMYSPADEAGHRPDRANIVYTSKLKQLFPDTLVVLGGVEASLRRFAHYDFWDDKVRRSNIFDTKADLLVYGMAEIAIIELAKKLSRIFTAGESAPLTEETKKLLTNELPNLALIRKSVDDIRNAVKLPSFEEVSMNKENSSEAFKLNNPGEEKKHPKPSFNPVREGFWSSLRPNRFPVKSWNPFFVYPLCALPIPNTPRLRFRRGIS